MQASNRTSLPHWSKLGRVIFAFLWVFSVDAYCQERATVEAPPNQKAPVRSTYEQTALDQSTFKSLQSALAQAELKAQEQMKGPDGANYAYTEFSKSYSVVKAGYQREEPGLYERLGVQYLRAIEAEYENIRDVLRMVDQKRFSNVRVWDPGLNQATVARLRETLTTWEFHHHDLRAEVNRHTRMYVESGGRNGSLLDWYQQQSSASYSALSSLRSIISFTETIHSNIPTLHQIVAEAAALAPGDRHQYIRSHRICNRVSI